MIVRGVAFCATKKIAFQPPSKCFHSKKKKDNELFSEHYAYHHATDQQHEELPKGFFYLFINMLFYFMVLNSQDQKRTKKSLAPKSTNTKHLNLQTKKQNLKNAKP